MQSKILPGSKEKFVKVNTRFMAASVQLPPAAICAKMSGAAINDQPSPPSLSELEI